MRRALAPLGVPNYRRFFAGQLVSLSGTWIQTVAELWLVLQLTGSALALGLVGALQFTPMLLVGPFAGVLADRLPKRRLLITTQLWMAVPAVSLLGLTLAGAVELWMVYALVLLRGVGQAVDHPTRQAFVMEMVGPAQVAGAVSLNAALVSCARLAGPAIGGLLISAAGVAPCFALNALSFAAVVWALAGMDRAALHTAPPVARERGQLRSGLRYVARTPQLLVPLGAMAVVGTLAFNFNVPLPVMAEQDFAGDASLYGTLAAAMGAGAVAGALGNAARGGHGIGRLALITLAFGGALAAIAAAPGVGAAIAALVLLGAASTAFSATVNTVLQLSAAPQMRGRVMALFSVLLLGSTPIGSPLAGWIAEHGGARTAWLVAALATLAVGGALAWLARSPRLRLEAPGGRRALPQPAGPGCASAPARVSATGRARRPASRRPAEAR